MPHPQMFIPVFASGTVEINANLAYQKENGRVYYFNGHAIPIFTHEENDVRSFKMIMSQFYVTGIATQAQIIRAFGIPSITMKRAVKTFRTHGPGGFFNSNASKRKPRVLVPEVILKVQALLDKGLTTRQIAEQLDLKQNTLDKAIQAGRLKKKF